MPGIISYFILLSVVANIISCQTHLGYPLQQHCHPLGRIPGITCGRGPNAQFCPSGSECLFDHVNKTGFCCWDVLDHPLSPTVPNRQSQRKEIGICHPLARIPNVKCGAGPNTQRCPSDSDCLIDPVDGSGFCCWHNRESSAPVDGLSATHSSAGMPEQEAEELPFPLGQGQSGQGQRGQIQGQGQNGQAQKGQGQTGKAQQSQQAQPRQDQGQTRTTVRPTTTAWSTTTKAKLIAELAELAKATSKAFHRKSAKKSEISKSTKTSAKAASKVPVQNKPAGRKRSKPRVMKTTKVRRQDTIMQKPITIQVPCRNPVIGRNGRFLTCMSRCQSPCQSCEQFKELSVGVCCPVDLADCVNGQLRRSSINDIIERSLRQRRRLSLDDYPPLLPARRQDYFDVRPFVGASLREETYPIGYFK